MLEDRASDGIGCGIGCEFVDAGLDLGPALRMEFELLHLVGRL